MMLRRAVSDQAAAGDELDVAAGKPRGAALFAAPRLLVGLGAAKPGDCDSTARSPKSPLDLRAAFPAPGGSPLRSPRRSWDSQRVGLGGLVDTLAEPDAEAKTRMLGSLMRPSKLQCLTKSYRNTSLPKDCGLAQPEFGEIEAAAAAAAAGAGGMSVPCTRFYGDVKSGPEIVVSGGAQLGFSSHSTDLGKLWAPGSLPVSIGGPRRYIGSVSATEVEQSEDYTCIIAHGPNPKTIRILGDCILEPCTARVRDGKCEGIDEVEEGAGAESYWLVKCSDDTGEEESSRFCSCCKKNLDGKESCVYCGENGFSGGNCRDQEILNEGEHENKTVSSPNSSGSSSPFHEDDIFIDGMVMFT